jgi:hypothetical protein
MAAIQDVETSVAVVDKIREYYSVDKRLGGLIKVTRLLYSDRAGHSVHIKVPENFKEYDEYFINGVKFVPEPHPTERTR